MGINAVEMICRLQELVEGLVVYVWSTGCPGWGWVVTTSHEAVTAWKRFCHDHLSQTRQKQEALLWDEIKLFLVWVLREQQPS
jgi:hypothetical protein